MVKGDSCSLGNAGLQLFAQAGAMKREFHKDALQCPASNAAMRQRSSLLARKRTEKTDS